MTFKGWSLSIAERVRKSVPEAERVEVDDATITFRLGNRGVVLHSYADGKAALQRSGSGATEGAQHVGEPQVHAIDESSVDVVAYSIVAALQ